MGDASLQGGGEDGTVERGATAEESTVGRALLGVMRVPVRLVTRAEDAME